MSVSRILKRYPMEIGGLVITAICLLVAIPGMMQNMSNMGEMSRQIQQDANEQQRLQAQEESSKGLEQIANERFKRCLLIRTPGKNTLIAVAPGIRVVDTETTLPLAPGTIVCSIDGNTGIVGPDGMVGDVAFTGNKEAVASAIQRSGISLIPGSKDYGSSSRTYQK